MTTTKNIKAMLKEYAKTLEALKDLGADILDEYMDNEEVIDNLDSSIWERVDEVQTMEMHIDICLDIVK